MAEVKFGLLQQDGAVRLFLIVCEFARFLGNDEIFCTCF